MIRFCVVLLLITAASSVHAQKTDRVRSDQLNEISGLVSSTFSDSIFFAVNDSGDSSRFFAIDTRGRLLETFHYKGSVSEPILGVTDCEEMAWGPGIRPGKNYLYIGDIGDNKGIRPFITIYGFEEPMIQAERKTLSQFVIHLRYPDHPRDAEAFVIDPILKTICVISKREDTVGIYETSLDVKDGDTAVLEKKGSLSFPQTGGLYAWEPVAADISRDGKQFLLKTYGSVYYWKRKEKETVPEMLSRAPVRLPYKREPQGESIAFNRKGTAYYCISEGLHPIIYYYSLK
jgi:hypothetical protein